MPSPTAASLDDEVDNGQEEEEDDEYGSKGRPVRIIDGSSGGKADFKKWRNTTVHPIHIGKKMTTSELLVKKIDMVKKI